MLARHVAGLRAVAAMERAPHQPLPPIWRARVEELARALGIARAVAVRLTDEVIAPCTARLMRPVVWLPLSMLSRTPAEQVEALIAHELAHIARRDWLWNGLQCVVESLLFFHPAVWWLGRRIREEREHACDDLAVKACGDPIALAEALAALEIGRRGDVRLALAARGGSLLQRVARLLSAPPARGRRGVLAFLGALGLAGLLVVGQTALAGGGLPDLEVRSSTAGKLSPGDWREIHANGVDGRRFYRISLDAQGGATEIYREDGRARPIDGDVRDWIAGVSRLGVPTAPLDSSRMAPLAPLAPLATSEPAGLIALIASHPAVASRVGTPVRRTSDLIDGNVRAHGDGSRGDADIRVEFVGPRGRATAAVKADRRGEAWTVRSLVVR